MCFVQFVVVSSGIMLDVCLCMLIMGFLGNDVLYKLMFFYLRYLFKYFSEVKPKHTSFGLPVPSLDFWSPVPLNNVKEYF